MTCWEKYSAGFVSENEHDIIDCTMSVQNPTPGIPPKIVERAMLDAVDITIRALCPSTYDSLCYLYAVIGANVMSIALKRNYRPVAGIAIMDAGGGKHLEFLDDSALERGMGGSYHCWIESAEEKENQKQLVDFTFGNNPGFAEANGIPWKAWKADYLWGRAKDINIGGKMSALPKKFPAGMVWFQETNGAREWLADHLQKHANDYAKMTFLALRQYNQKIEEFRNKKSNFRERLKEMTAI
jgi:hypothetical protein